MNAYKILQVDRDAEPEVIDAAYRRLGSKYHPDKDPSPSATARMKEIDAAYELLRDPVRRAEYDRRRERLRTERPRPEANAEPKPDEPTRGPAPAPPPSTVESQDLAAEVSNRVFSKVLWAGACIALLLYFPWGAGILISVGVLIWFARRFPGAVTKILTAGLALGVAIAAYFWVRGEVREQKVEEGLAKLDVQDLFLDQVSKYNSGCLATVSANPPEVTKAYCACVTDVLRSRFDLTPINATTVEAYRSEFAARAYAAMPDERSREGCLQRAQPKPVATTKPKRQPPKLAEPTADELDRAVREALSPARGGQATPVADDMRRPPSPE